MEMREFTSHDWGGFAGAEAWPDDALPLIGEGAFQDGTGFVIVLDRAGGCLVIEEDPQNDYGGYVLSLPFPSQAAARAFAVGMGVPPSLDHFLTVGFHAI